MQNVSTRAEALEFVERHGVVLESGRGPAPSLAEAIVGARLAGSWWSHPQAKTIFDLTRAVRDDPSVLVCKAIGGKVTFIHNRLWPAIVRVSGLDDPSRFDRIVEEHTAAGRHIVTRAAYPAWVPQDVVSEASVLELAKAKAMLEVLLNNS